METKQIVVYPNDILTTPTKKTDLKTAQELAVELFKTLKQEGGLGLSANQIGEDKSVCVVDVTNPFFLLNPVIKKSSKEIIYKEGEKSISFQPSKISLEIDFEINFKNVANKRIHTELCLMEISSIKVDGENIPKKKTYSFFHSEHH